MGSKSNKTNKPVLRRIVANVKKVVKKETIKKTALKKAVKKKSVKSKKDVQKEFLKLSYRFKNNDEKWLALLLTENCILLESYRLVEKELENIFGDKVIYFLPIYLDEKVPGLGIQLFDGYIFVKCSGTICESTFSRRTDYLDKILYKGSNPYFITNRDINKFKTQLKKDLEKRVPVKGSRVISNEGTFKNQEGTVISVNKNKKTAIIEFPKRTRIVTAKLSVINFDKIR